MNQEATGSAVMVNGQKVSNLTLEGAMVFKDPDNAIYNFLQSSPLAYSRISSHQATMRNLGHAWSYVKCIFAGAECIDRKEHGHKNLLQTPVYEPFMQVVKSAEKLGLTADASAHKKKAKEIGIPYLESTLAQLKKTIARCPNCPLGSWTCATVSFRRRRPSSPPRRSSVHSRIIWASSAGAPRRMSI